MHITSLRIRHFRNFLKARFLFRKGVNTLIGENASGKTNALYALRLLLDETLTRNAMYLRETDFCRDLHAWQGHWITIAVDFADLDPSEGCQLLRHIAGHMDGTNTGTYSFFFRPKPEVRKQLHEFSGRPNKVTACLESLSLDDYEPLVTGRGRGDLLDDSLYRQCVGDFKNGVFPNPEDDNQDVLGVKISPIHQEVACTFVRALRDVITELRGYRNNPLLTLLRGMESSLEITDAQRLIQKVDDLNADISSLDEIRDLASGIETVLRKAVGHTYGPSVSIESALPGSIEKLLQRLHVLVGDSSSSDYRGELNEQSLGGANLIYLALKLLEYELKLSSDRVAHFLLVEEPEAHIHTHIQRALFGNLPSEKTQVIVSTHSTYISSASRITSVNVLAKKDDHAEVYQPSTGLPTATIRRVERYLDAVRSTLLFAKGVLLVEGDAEQILIPAMLRATFGLTPDELGFSVIGMGSSFFGHLSLIFSEERLQRPCAIVTDLDQPLVDLPENPENDTTEEAHARAAAKAGRLRKALLEKALQDNPWTRAFYANRTFEVEFIAAGNSGYVGQMLRDIYTSGKQQEKSRTLLQSSELSSSGKEVLRLAKKLGKGWFSLLLSEKLDAGAGIPNYILRSIAFACYPNIALTALRQIGRFRAEMSFPDPKVVESLATLGPEEFLLTFRELAPTDCLSHFCQYLQEYQDLANSKPRAEESGS